MCYKTIAKSVAGLLTSPCDCASTSVVLVLPAFEVTVFSQGGLGYCWVRLGLSPQHKGWSLPEGSLACSKPPLVLIAQLVEEALQQQQQRYQPHQGAAVRYHCTQETYCSAQQTQAEYPSQIFWCHVSSYFRECDGTGH